ncbi:hypothetical protein B0A50_08103 [Salinomyces thailandicus]|uniref:Sas10 C-terminal domain-containing protein n=1 Tax=Salinomyces thailandicus TaxID=706561 RepID=A0A4U0TK67_9PEZI|nr:hypothetical protein B0A50_08103 [Salinomyces thailandica]
MAKRKRQPKVAEAPKGPNMDVGELKKRIRSYEDVADSDDEFHLQRDRVMLGEGPEAKRRKNHQEQEAFLQPSDEEVLSYSEPEEDDEEDFYEQEDAARYRQDGARSGSAEEDDVEDEDEESGWGTSKADLYGADEIETEEQALEEEQEALRLQRKQLQSMTAADYGFDESEWQATGADAADEEEGNSVVIEKLPQLQVTEDMSPAERLKLLKTRYPEFEPLSKELLRIREVHSSMAKATQRAGGSAMNAMTKYRAASAYLGALTMYFSLLTSPAWKGQGDVMALNAVQLRDHPVMDTLVQCRELWQRVQGLSSDESAGQEVVVADQNPVSTRRGVTDGESRPSKKQKQQPPKSRAERHAEAAQAAADARRAERLAKTEAGLADLDALVANGAHRKSAKSKRDTTTEADNDSDIGEEAPLTAQEAEAKAKQKKSLRFYTSQIAQKANKRGASGRNAGGDEDVPHRERLRDRQTRLNAEAEKRGKRDADAGDALGGESDEEDNQQARQIRAAAGDDEYYDLIASRTAKKKSDKAAYAEAQKQAALQGGMVVEEATVGPDGKRKISYAIEKNKGLTPFRKKDVRNPRVKKRRKFDEKKKKLASMKPVYKGGEGRGGYGGEMTGIKKGLVKSTKL